MTYSRLPHVIALLVLVSRCMGAPPYGLDNAEHYKITYDYENIETIGTIPYYKLYIINSNSRTPLGASLVSFNAGSTYKHFLVNVDEYGILHSLGLREFDELLVLDLETFGESTGQAVVESISRIPMDTEFMLLVRRPVQPVHVGCNLYFSWHCYNTLMNRHDYQFEYHYIEGIFEIRFYSCAPLEDCKPTQSVVAGVYGSGHLPGSINDIVFHRNVRICAYAYPGACACAQGTSVTTCCDIEGTWLAVEKYFLKNSITVKISYRKVGSNQYLHVTNGHSATEEGGEMATLQNSRSYFRLHDVSPRAGIYAMESSDQNYFLTLKRCNSGEPTVSLSHDASHPPEESSRLRIVSIHSRIEVGPSIEV